jgi:ABC-2 type transport system permease protein
LAEPSRTDYRSGGFAGASLLAVTTHAAGAYGPSALGGGARRFVELTTTLARTEFKLRYFGSVLGYVWSLVRPLLFFGILYLFFTQIVRIGQGTPHYGVYLLTGIVLWNYFAEATGSCVSCLVTREGLLRKIRFPRMVIPLSVSLTAAFNLVLNFVPVIVFALANGLSPTVRWLELVPIAGALVVLGTGFGMLLSALYVRYRDVQPIWEVTLQAWFYCSPIMYTASAYGSSSRVGFGSKALEHAALINPMATLLTQMGHAMIGGSHFPAAPTAGGLLSAGAALALIPAIFALGWWFFTREAPRVAENL